MGVLKEFAADALKVSISDSRAAMGCDAALAASLFHFGELTVPQVKEYLAERMLPVR